VAAAGFSALSNLLYLAPSLFMLQVYDRVLPSRGLGTLAGLGVVTLFALAALAGFEWLRSRLLIRASARLEAELATPVLEATMRGAALSRLARSEAMRHLEALRQGVASPSMVAAFDAPWTPVYVAVGFMLHWSLGLAMILSGAALLLLAWLNDRIIATPMKLASDAAGRAYARQAHSASYAAEVRALGMVTALARSQAQDRELANGLQTRASFAAGDIGSIIRFFRLALQSATLALGAVLVIEDQISAGAMIAASLLMTRALAPVEQVVAAWRQLISSRIALARLRELFLDDAQPVRTLLPRPTGTLQVEGLTVVAPHDERRTLTDVSFALTAGEIVGLVGHSGAGKTTLLRALGGAVEPTAGQVRLDGASRSDWDPERLARHIGYLPQDPVLFPGTIKENIVRFRHALGEDDDATLDAAAIAAAEAIGAHEMIARLPQGYDTPVGAGGTGLSAGQAQRIAIARALFGDPALLLLDEPTAHLDADAQRAFAAMLVRQRTRGATVLFATHSTDALAGVDKLLVLAAGRVERFGPIVATPATPPVSKVTPVTFHSWKA
jgi:ATP-binding cassette subfamily C protein